MLTISAIEQVIGSKLAQLAHLTIPRSEQVTFGAACRRFRVLWLPIRQAPVPDSMRARGLALLDGDHLRRAAKCDLRDASRLRRLLDLTRCPRPVRKKLTQEPLSICAR